MASFKVVQKIASVTGNATSGSIALKSGYLRVTPAGGDAFVEVGTDPTAADDSSIYVPQKSPVVFKGKSCIFKYCWCNNRRCFNNIYLSNWNGITFCCW